MGLLEKKIGTLKIHNESIFDDIGDLSNLNT